MLIAVSFGTVVMVESLKTFCVLSNYCIIRISYFGNQKKRYHFYLSLKSAVSKVHMLLLRNFFGLSHRNRQ